MSKVQHTPFTLGRHTSFDILTNGVARFVVRDTHTDTTDYRNPRRACARINNVNCMGSSC